MAQSTFCVYHKNRVSMNGLSVPSGYVRSLWTVLSNVTWKSFKERIQISIHELLLLPQSIFVHFSQNVWQILSLEKPIKPCRVEQTSRYLFAYKLGI